MVLSMFVLTLFFSLIVAVASFIGMVFVSIYEFFFAKRIEKPKLKVQKPYKLVEALEPDHRIDGMENATYGMWDDETGEWIDAHK